MISGLIIAGHVHLSKIARAVHTGVTNIHAVEKKLSRHLASEHWNMTPVDDFLLQHSAAMIGEDTLIPAEATRPMAGAIPGARYEEIPDAGHLSNMEAPGEFNRLLADHLERCEES